MSKSLLRLTSPCSPQRERRARFDRKLANFLNKMSLHQIVHFAFISFVLRRSRKGLLYNTAYVLRACGKDFYDTLPAHKQCGKVEGKKPKCGHQYVGNAVRPDTK